MLDRHDAWDEAAWADGAERAVLDEVDRLVEAWRATTRRVVAVTNEVGQGVVPATASGRRFRDLMGLLNARLVRPHRGRPVVRGRSRGAAVRDALRLALGTLTVLRVRPPGRVDRRTAGRAMLLAPLVGLLLAAVVLAVLWLLGGSAWLVGPSATLHGSGLTPLVAAVAVVGLLALLTRGLHLDGLADTADGLGSGRPAEGALAVMRRSDVGPFGVVTLLLVLLLQVAALQALLSRGQGAAAVVTALVVSRLVLPLVCSRGVPAARTDGLGSAVAGSVSRGQLLVSGRADGRRPGAAARAGRRPGTARRRSWPTPGGRPRRCWCRWPPPRCWRVAAYAGWAGSPATCWAPASRSRSRPACWSPRCR